jgi:hypothetical protein
LSTVLYLQADISFHGLLSVKTKPHFGEKTRIPSTNAVPLIDGTVSQAGNSFTPPARPAGRPLAADRCHNPRCLLRIPDSWLHRAGLRAVLSGNRGSIFSEGTEISLHHLVNHYFSRSAEDNDILVSRNIFGTVQTDCNLGKFDNIVTI